MGLSKPGLPTKREVTRFVEENELKAEPLPILGVNLTSTRGSAAKDTNGNIPKLW
jgi:hypothetical protein